MIHDIKQTIFGVPIWGVILNEEKSYLQNYIDTILQCRQSEPSSKKSNFGGYQTHEDLFQNLIFKNLVSYIEQISNQIISNQTSVNFSVEIKELWGNINTYRDFNAAHTHSGILSGVFYLQVPKNSGRLILTDPAVRSEGKFITNSDYPIYPEPAACILFPSWLEHYVEPNLSNDERISLSFNIDKK